VTDVNKAQREQWNAPVQATRWPKREPMTTMLTPMLLERLALRPGERVLDIGCGGGLAAIEAARAVAPSGTVVGFDISTPLVDLAMSRAKEGGVLNAQFVVGDAQVDAPPGGPFDAVMSQFGVMFSRIRSRHSPTSATTWREADAWRLSAGSL
jgi:protein-L-isoaspartate O-methyltransferase